MIYELELSGGGWVESVLYDELGDPSGGVIFDAAGNLYGATRGGGTSNDGAIYQLQPSGSGWTFNTLASFDGSNGSAPIGGLVMDAAGNLYGTTSTRGLNGGVRFSS